MRDHQRLAIFLGMAGLGIGCGGEPAVWDAPDWDANTVEALALRGQLGTLASGMREVEEGASFDAASLNADFNAGDPSLSDVTHAGYAPIITDSFTEFGELVAVGAIEPFDGEGAWAPGDHGGIMGTDARGLNEGGIEVRQLVDKGLFGGGALYAYALDLTADGVDAAEVEAIAAVWGADETLTIEGTLDDSANYGASMGYFDAVADGLTAAHASPSDEQALVDAFRAWEISLFARFIHYLHVAVTDVQTSLEVDSFVHASHALSEGLGLVMGFHGLDGPSGGPLASAPRVATDAQIEAICEALGVDVSDLGASTLGALMTDPAAFDAARLEAEAAVANAFGLTADEVLAMREEVQSE
jgi:hypothetical protein